MEQAQGFFNLPFGLWKAGQPCSSVLFFIVNCWFLRFNEKECRSWEPFMKPSAIIIGICFSFLVAGCSKEEPPAPPPTKPKVVKRISQPAPPTTMIDSDERRVVKPGGYPIIKKEEKPPEIRDPILKKDEKVPEKEQAVRAEKAGVTKEPSPDPGKDISSRNKKDEPEGGFYLVQPGDSLSRISGRKDVYGDPLNWPIILRLNMDRLGTMTIEPDFPGRSLPEGLRLRVLPPEEAKKRMKSSGQDPWVVNVMSSPLPEKINAGAISLIRRGYRVYITRVMVKGEEWMRLRVGFFKGRDGAMDEGEKIKKLLQLTDSWPVKIGPDELEKFGGF